MCLYIIDDSGFPASRMLPEKIATEDIVVYKIINKNNKSYHQYFQYTPYTLYKLNTKLKCQWCMHPDIEHVSFYISEGFHAYMSRELFSNLNLSNNESWKLVQFIIPKGASYYLGTGREIVSDQIRSGNLMDLREKPKIGCNDGEVVL